MDQFLRDVEAFLALFNVRPSLLGKQAVNDGSLVTRLRQGRAPTLATVDKVYAWMERYGKEHPIPRDKATTKRRGRPRRAAAAEAPAHVG
jgi:hypothetical protein